MKIVMDEGDLRPLIEATVQATIERLESQRERLGDHRLGYIEPEAAAMIGVPVHVLRDCRLRGEIGATKAGKRWVYTRAELLRFLGRNGKA